MANITIKAVIFDLDGTAIDLTKQGSRHDKPTKRVIESVKQAQGHGLKISCATGRNYSMAKPLIDKLGVKDPSIINAGSQIIDPQSGNEVWSEPLTIDGCRHALHVLRPHKFKIILEGEILQEASSADQIKPGCYNMLDVQHVPVNILPALLEELSRDTSITSIPVHSSDPNKVFLHITNSKATKAHAVEKLIDILGVDKAEVAGVGDALNDIELFKSVGIKVAMGNGAKELKKAADIVVDSVDEDGLAKYLESLCQ